MRRLVAAGVGLLMAAVGTEAVVLSQQPATAHALPRDFGPVTPATSGSSTPASPTRPAGRPQPVAPPVSPTQAAVTPSVPVRVSIPSLHAAAPITPVSLNAANSLVVPHDPHVIGWWQASALAGSDLGTIVLDGHVDTAHEGLGTLFHLQDIDAGATITVSSANGHRYIYQVTARRVLSKSHGLPTDLFSPTAPGTLVVITCGGPFNRATQSYLDNIAVLARPVTP